MQIESLKESEVHVWKFSLRGQNTQPACILSKSEKERASQYISNKDKDYFELRRTVLRIILGGYLYVEPSKVMLEENIYGKPFIANRQLNFNLSKSNEWVYYAISKNVSTGIDIEKIQPIQLNQEMEQLVFHAWEYEVYQQLPYEKKQHFFYRCWTQKEALVKGLGVGLRYPLKDTQNIPFMLTQLKTPEGYIGFLASSSQAIIKYYLFS